MLTAATRVGLGASHALETSVIEAHGRRLLGYLEGLARHADTADPAGPARELLRPRPGLRRDGVDGMRSRVADVARTLAARALSEHAVA